MRYTFELVSCAWDTRNSFAEHQGESPEEQQRLNKHLGIRLDVENGRADSIDAALNQVIDIINDETGSMFHGAVVKMVRGRRKTGEEVKGTAVQDLGAMYERFPSRKQEMLEDCPTFIFDRKQEVFLASPCTCS